MLLAMRAMAAEVEFSGATSFSAEQLRQPLKEQLAEIDAKGLTPARADDAAFFLGSYYRKSGFARAEVGYEIRGKKLVLRIDEGPKALVRSVKFSGNKSKPADVLAEYLIGVKPENLAEEKLPFQAADVAAGIGRIRGFYASEGWLDTTAEVNENPVSADGTSADLVVTIAEGTRYVFGEVTFTGDADYERAQLLEWLGAVPEGAFTPWAVEGMQRSLQSSVRRKGYFSAKVTAEWDKATAKGGRVPVRFVIVRGREFRVGSVELRGLERVKPEFMQRRFAGIDGAVYDPEKLDEKYRELLRTGLFRNFRMTPTEDGPGKLRIDVEVEEAKQKSFGFDAGVGSYDGVTIGVSVGDRNFMRWGRPAELNLSYSQRGFRGEFLHNDPWFLDTQWALRSRIFSEVRDEQGYSKSQQGFRFEFARKLTPRWEVSAFVETAFTKISDSEIDPLLIGRTDYLLTALGVAQKLDYRDDVTNPRRGWVLTSSVDLDALDGSLAFGRVTARYSRYYSIGKSLLALGLRGGWIIPTQGSALDVPIDLRYFNGGGTTVRSFADRQLGPKDSGDNPLGGTVYTVANIEWDFPIYGAIGGAVFFDAGNLALSDSPDFTDIRYAIGLGLRYDLPIGPMRLDYGFNPDAREGEDMGAVHFSFGFAF